MRAGERKKSQKKKQKGKPIALYKAISFPGKERENGSFGDSCRHYRNPAFPGFADGSEVIVYTVKNFRTKKALKDALKNGEIVYLKPDLFGGISDGTVFIEGPHFPEMHTWYAEGKSKNGILVSVK